MTALRVLLVDDESCVLESLALVLEMAGFEIAGTASDLAGAVKLAGEAEADVAVLDVHLGGEPVFPAADVFVARDIPILFTSGRMIELPPRFSATTFIEKPYLPEILIDQVERLTSRAHEIRLTSRFPVEKSAGRLLAGLANSATTEPAKR
jgi:DNA-binding NarL/FixJ family response regulator